MSNIDYEEGMRDKPLGISDIEKFRILAKKYPNRFMHYKIFAHLIRGFRDDSNHIELNLVEDVLDIEKYYKRVEKFPSSLQKNIFDYYGQDFINLIQMKIYKIFKKYHNIFARGEQTKSTKDILLEAKQEALYVAKLELQKTKDKLLKSSDDKKKQEIRKINIDKHDEALQILINKILDRRTKIVNTWMQEGRTGKIQQLETKVEISNLFNVNINIWHKPFYDIESFDSAIFQNPILELDTDQENREKFLIGKNEKLSTNEVDEFEEIDMDNIDIKKYKLYSPEFMYNLAEELKEKNKVSLALKALDILIKNRTTYSYRYRGKILHLKAVLLSSPSQAKWDDAIDILSELFAYAEYHKKDPEILTLLGSNFKRKALFDVNGLPKEEKKVDLTLIMQALSYYGMSMEMSKTKYYDAVNIIYLERILRFINGEYKKNENNIITKVRRKEEIKIRLLFSDLKDSWELNLKDWWEVTTQIEFYILLGDDASAIEMYEAYEGTFSHFGLEATIRQIEIYVYYSDDSLAKGFLELLKEDLEKL